MRTCDALLSGEEHNVADGDNHSYIVGDELHRHTPQRVVNRKTWQNATTSSGEK